MCSYCLVALHVLKTHLTGHVKLKMDEAYAHPYG